MIKIETIEAMQDDMAPETTERFIVLDDEETYGVTNNTVLVVIRNGIPRYFDLGFLVLALDPLSENNAVHSLMEEAELTGVIPIDWDRGTDVSVRAAENLSPAALIEAANNGAELETSED